MKKILSSLLIFTLIISLITPCIYADGGETDSEEELYSNTPYIFLTDGNWDDAQNIYSSSNAESEVQGASYDKNTNTLTIENLTTNKQLSIMSPGTDFTLCVLGTNSLDGGLHAFSMWGDGGIEVVGVTITGTGTLKIDTEEENAILLGSYFGGSTLTVGRDVTLNLKSTKDVIAVETVTEKNGPTDRIKFENESLNIEVAHNIYSYTGPKNIEVYYPSSNSSGEDNLGERVKNKLDPDGIYTASLSYRDEDGDEVYETPVYTIEKWILADSIGYYICDRNFESNTDWGTYELSAEQFAASEYEYILDSEEEHIWLQNPTYLDSGTEDVYKDKDDKRYAVIDVFHWNDETETSYYTKEVYDIVKEISELPGKYFITKNETVSADDLEEVIEETVFDDVYNYTIQTPELVIAPETEHVHNLVEVPGKQAECEEDGNLPYYRCTGCNNWYVDGEGNELIANHSEVIIKKLGHDYKTTVTKATLTTNGLITKRCSRDDSETVEAIFHPQTFTLSKTSYTYNGKAQKPTVTIKDCEGYTIDKSNYDVKYSSGCKNVGVYTVTITFKGNYDGSKKLTYKINPKGTTLSKVKAGKKSFTATWKKQTTWTTGYELMYSTSKTFKSGNKTVKIAKNKTVKTTVKKLEAKKKYYVKVRTYKTVNGKKYYSGWSAVKTVTTKK